ncbi:c-type cytochrome [Zhongshania sp.]|uniref:c-type cytochrome n=1 Tax=Zhongshania sp. TaxID=1971902 RepID=UPI001B593942|nr:c-type cytochrome [Zhongshania sp.]MBQ0794760.1 cytochrome c5 family protein [Zhongshania sp.]
MLKKLVAAFGLVMVCVSAWALTDKQMAEVESRIQPAGKVCLQGDNTCGAAVASAGGAAKSGEEVYKSSCQGCHATGAGNAPKLGDAADWGKRAEQGSDTLYKHAIEGFSNIGMMPAKGLCMSCSDEEVMAAVDYILENSK